MKITAHTIVKNEDQWIYFALQSVLPFVKKILIYDTGSSDKTVEIIRSINSPKILFEEKGQVDKIGMTQLRQEQLEKTQTDWFLILDGDEIWSRENLQQTINLAKSAPKNVVAIINSVRNCVGDVFHYLPEEAGRYEIAGHQGNLNIRLIKKTKDMQVVGEYPLEYYGNQNGPIQNQNKNLIFTKAWYLHTSFLKRSSAKVKKNSGSFGRKKVWQKGIEMSTSQLPEVLGSEGFPRRGRKYELLAGLLDPALRIKRKFK